MGLRNRSLFDKKGNIYFVTTTVVNWDKIFSIGDNYCEILIGSIKYLLHEHQSQIIAYIIMPSHIHLIILMKKGESISDFMRDFKKYSSTKVRQKLEMDGYYNIVARLRTNSIGHKKQVFKLWKDRFDDILISNEKILKIKINYIHYNPVKASLVNQMEDWKYSSARNYLLDDHSIIEVNTEWNFEFDKLFASGRKS